DIGVTGVQTCALPILQRGARAVGLGEAAGNRVLHRLESVFALALGDVAADAAVADEASGGVEHRLAGERQPDRGAVGAGALHLEVVERLVALELRAVPRPAGL